MSDFEKTVDVTRETAGKILKESEQLAAAAKEAVAAKEELLKRCNWPADATKRLIAKLSDEERKQVEEEEERFYRELKHDLDAAVENALPGSTSVKTAVKRPRNMV